MKNNLLLLCAIALFILSACDIVEEPYSKNNESPEPIDTNKPKILLEDFTGQLCVNCPRAAKLAHDLQERYPGRIIVVGIHGGTFAKPEASSDKYKYDFRIPESIELSNHYDADNIGNPCGMISRDSFQTKLVMGTGYWSYAIENFWQKHPTREVEISLNANIDSVSRNIKADVSVKYFATQSQQNRICVWILEDNIIGWQKSEEPPYDIPDYVHKNVLRYVFNGTWGESVSSSNNIPVGFEFNKTYNYNLPANKDWNISNLRAIAFVYDDIHGVKNVEEAKINFNFTTNVEE